MHFLFYFFGGIGVWIQVFMFARQVLYHLSHFTSPNLIINNFYII
jgi:hypothetical protein